MKHSRFQLTKPAKVLVMLLVIALLGTGVWFGVKSGFVDTSSLKPSDNPSTSADPGKTNTPNVSTLPVSVDNTNEDGNIINTEKSDTSTINLSLDEWIGWKSIIDANGGLSTQPGSIYDNLWHQGQYFGDQRCNSV